MTMSLLPFAYSTLSEKRPIDSVAVLKTAVVTYHLLIRLKRLLILQSARRPVGRGKVLYCKLAKEMVAPSCCDDSLEGR